jgi:hypothetical protein
MAQAVAFVEELAEVTIRPNGVSIVCRSGAEAFAFRCDRSLWRQFLEREIRALNEFEIAERGKRKVVKIAERGHR